MKSIRRYLLTRLLAGAAVVLLVAGTLLYFVLARALETQFDAALTDRVQAFMGMLFQTKDEVAFEFSDELMPEYDAERRPGYFQLWFADGALIERSNTLGDRDLVLDGEPGYSPRHWTAALPDGRSGRYVAQVQAIHHVYPEEGPGRPEAGQVLVVLARGREALIAAERAVLLRCIGAGLVLLAVLAAIAWRAVARGLEPARRLWAALDEVRMDDLPERFDAGELPEELEPMASKADALIARADQALRRERRTSADIAHELRTPISELITSAEVALRAEPLDETQRTTLTTVRDVAWRMARSVSTLLELARLEALQGDFERTLVDLDLVARDLIRGHRGSAQARGLRLTYASPGSVRCLGNPEVLRIVLTNLLGNALTYAPPESEVQCSVTGPATGATLELSNEARNLTAGDLDAIADPFWRKDPARVDRDRSGLGLALSRALAERSAMRLRFEFEDGLFRAHLTLEPAPGRGAAPLAHAD